MRGFYGALEQKVDLSFVTEYCSGFGLELGEADNRPCVVLILDWIVLAEPRLLVCLFYQLINCVMRFLR